MLIRAIAVEGLSGLPRFQADGLSRVVKVAGPLRARTALADALTLALCPFSADDISAAGEHLGWGRVEVRTETLPREVTLQRPHAALRLLAPADRAGKAQPIRIDLTIALDPPQVEILRQASIREPGLSGALVGGVPLSLSVGWLFTRDGSVGSPSLLGFGLGEIRGRPGELPDWLVPLFRGMARRTLRRLPGTLPLALIDAAERDPSPQRRAALRQMKAELSGPPFHLGRLELLRAEDGALEMAFGDDLVPLRALGPEAKDAVGLAATVHLQSSEILLLEAPLALATRRDAWLRWLTHQVEADGSPLEQIWLFGAEGPDALRPRAGS